MNSLQSSGKKGVTLSKSSSISAIATAATSSGNDYVNVPSVGGEQDYENGDVGMPPPAAATARLF